MGRTPYLLQEKLLQTGTPGYNLSKRATGLVLHAGQTLTGLVGSSCTLSVVTCPVAEPPLSMGTKVVRCNLTASGSVTLTLGQNLNGMGDPVIALYWPGVDAVLSIVGLTTSDNFANYHDHRHYVTHGWNYIRLPRSFPYTTSGSAPNYGQINRIRLNVTATSYPQTFYIAWARAGLFFKPQLMMVWDDEYANVKTVVQPLMNTYGFRGAIAWAEYFSLNGVDRSGIGTYMNRADGLAMQNTYGWDIINHSRYHIDQTGASVATLVDDYGWNQDELARNGMAANGSNRIVCYPFGGGAGAVEANLKTAMAQLGVTMSRGTRRGFQTTSPAAVDAPPFDTPLHLLTDPYGMKIVSPRSGTYKPAYGAGTLMAPAAGSQLYELDQFIAMGGVCWRMGHSVPSAAAGDSGDDTIENSGDLEAFLQGVYLRVRAGRLDVIKPTELLSKITGERRSIADFISYATISRRQAQFDADNSAIYSDAGTTAAIIDVAGGVYRWNDLSGGAYHADQATVNLRPTLKSTTNNGKTFRYVRFAKAAGPLDQRLATGAWTALVNPIHRFVVARVDVTGVGGGNLYFADGRGNFAVMLFYRGATTNWATNNGISMYADASDTDMAGDNNWHLFEIVANGLTSKLFVDGAMFSSSGGTNVCTGLTIGGANDGSLTAGVADIAYDTLCVGDHELAGDAPGHRAYLMDRYGITPKVNQYEFTAS